MVKLTQAGELYLKDYLILNEAKIDAIRFLDALAEEVYNRVSEEKDDISPNDFKIGLWKNKSSKGHMTVEFVCLADKKMFRKNQADIGIGFRDIRSSTNHSNPISGILYVYSPTVASKLKKRLKELSLEILGEDIYDTKIIEFDLTNSIKTAKNIAEKILEKSNFIKDLIEKINVC